MCSLERIALGQSSWKRKHNRVAGKVRLSGLQISRKRDGGTSQEVGVEKGR